jgi:hypothetical protein
MTDAHVWSSVCGGFWSLLRSIGNVKCAVMVLCVLESELHFSYSLRFCGEPCTVFWMRCQLEFKRPMSWIWDNVITNIFHYRKVTSQKVQVFNSQNVTSDLFIFPRVRISVQGLRFLMFPLSPCENYCDETLKWARRSFIHILSNSSLPFILTFSTGLEDWWAPEPVWTRWRREKNSILVGNRTPFFQPVA